MKATKQVMICCLLGLICQACIEPYEFEIKKEEAALVVEGFVSDVSYLETLSYPSDGRFFSVKLRYTNDVTNARDRVEPNAVVFLEDDEQNQWYYKQAEEEPGTYRLEIPDFKVYKGRKYRIGIQLPTDEQYYSEWSALPEVQAPPMGELSFNETSQQRFVYKGKEREVDDIAGVELMLNLPPHANDQPIYYRWDFNAVWIWVAPLAYSSDTFYRCWARNKNYLNNYTLQNDPNGGYEKALLFLQAKGNERVYEEFSLLVTQFILNEEAYYFWQEMQELAGPGGVFDKPPYNLKTNMYSSGNSKKAVYGYFTVVMEQAKRWNFNILDLSYPLENNLKEICLLPYGPPARGELDACKNCMGYLNGEPTIQPPNWWEIR